MKPLKDILVKPAGPDCNLACTYCFYSEKVELFSEEHIHRMSDDTLRIMTRQLMEDSTSAPYIGWQGGEPTLMGLEFFKKAVEFQKEFGGGRTASNGLQTNGILLNRKWAHFLRENSFLVGLSLDGPEHIHDRYRKTISGRGTWEKVNYVADMLLKNQVQVNAMSVINDYSVDYPEDIYTFLRNKGLVYMQFIPCVETHPDGSLTSFSVDPVKYGNFLCRIFDLWLKDFLNGQPTTSIRMFDSLFYHYSGKKIPGCVYQKECGQYVVVEHNGNVYPCDFFVGEHLLLGSIHDSSLLELLNSEKQNNFGQQKGVYPEECHKCRWLELCHGGCLKDRKPAGKNVPFNYFCNANKIFFEYSEREFQRIVSDWRHIHYPDEIQQKLKTSAKNTSSPGRNSPCPCGSGLKYKKCCGTLH